MIEAYWSSYKKLKEQAEERYFPPKDVEHILSNRNYANEIIGDSVENRPIYLLRLGNGPIKVLFWAQMHGNESTAARAMFDVWRTLSQKNSFNKSLFDQIQLHFIPQLNPDGAHHYTRLNAEGLDINRDFNQKRTPEMRVLQSVVEENNYDYLFNLHDQRTIFHPSGIQKPATLSFLAPVVDDQGSKPNNRVRAIQLISHILPDIQRYLPHQIARFSEAYYPEATGDNFQKLGYATILIECGHYPNDYQRNETRKFTYYALLKAITSIANRAHENDNGKAYHQLPQNMDTALDIIIYNVQVDSSNTDQVDIGIQYEEVLTDDRISFIAKIKKVGDLSEYFGHDICHAENRIFRDGSTNIPEIGKLANFNLSEWKVINGQVQKT